MFFHTISMLLRIFNADREIPRVVYGQIAIFKSITGIIAIIIAEFIVLIQYVAFMLSSEFLQVDLAKTSISRANIRFS